MQRITEFEEFCRALEMEAHEYALSEYGMGVRLEKEPGGQKGPAIVLENKNFTVWPMLEICSSWVGYKNGTASIGDCAKECVDELYKAKIYGEDVVKDMVLDVFEDHEKLKEALTLRLVNPKYFHGAYDLVGEDFLDLRAVVYISLECNGTMLGAGIRKNTAEAHGLSEKELFSMASEAVERDGALFDMNNVLKEAEFAVGDECDRLLVLTNKKKFYGAVSVTSKTLLEKVASITKGSFAILPSSVHEVLTLPCGSKDDLSVLNRMVNEVNDTVVMSAERLSDHAYFCDSNTLKISW